MSVRWSSPLRDRRSSGRVCSARELPDWRGDLSTLSGGGQWAPSSGTLSACCDLPPGHASKQASTTGRPTHLNKTQPALRIAHRPCDLSCRSQGQIGSLSPPESSLAEARSVTKRTEQADHRRLHSHLPEWAPKDVQLLRPGVRRPSEPIPRCPSHGSFAVLDKVTKRSAPAGSACARIESLVAR